VKQTAKIPVIFFQISGKNRGSVGAGSNKLNQGTIFCQSAVQATFLPGYYFLSFSAEGKTKVCEEQRRNIFIS